MQYEILKMNLVFMFLNMILLPLAGLVTYEQLLGFARDENFKIQDLIDAVSSNVGGMASFFAIYLMQVTFLSNLVQLFDIPHLLYKLLMKTIAYFKEKPYVDDFYF